MIICIIFCRKICIRIIFVRRNAEQPQFCKSFPIKNSLTLYRSGARCAFEFGRDRKKKKKREERTRVWSLANIFNTRWFRNPRGRTIALWTSFTICYSCDATRCCRIAGWRKPADRLRSLSSSRGSFDARNCAVAHETERFAMILLHGTKIR